MLFVCVITLFLLWLGAVWFGFLPPLNTRMLLHVRNGTILMKKGTLRPHARDMVTGILSEVGVTHGFIAIVPGSRVVFSHQIPANTYQRLRNILLNE